MNETEYKKDLKAEESENREEEEKKPKKPVKKTQGQIIQETLGLNPEDIENIEKKLFMVRFLDYFGEETLDFIFKDNYIKQYTAQTTAHINSFSTGSEEDKLLKNSFESKKIIEVIQNLKIKAEELAISKGVTTSMDKRLRRLTLIISLPLFAVIIGLMFIPDLNMFFLFPVLCIFCMLPQLLKGSIVRKWFAFKEQNKNQMYTENREDIMVLKSYATEVLENVRSKLIELRVPLQLIKFVLHSRDYENLQLINQRNIRGTMQYYYTFGYPPGMEPFPIPAELQQYQQPIFPEKKAEKAEKNFIVLTEMKGKEGIITYFVPTLKDALADKINNVLNNSEFRKVTDDFKTIIPKYAENLAIYCKCGEIAEITNVQICNWKNEFEFYLFEGEECKCGETVYALSLMDESSDVPEELKEIFLN